MATNYDINYDDERFQKVESEKQAALTENEKLYGDMISESDKYYQAQIDASKEWADTQTKLQQEQTDFAINKIEQEKDKAKKDYTKEQSGAYVDWQKQSNQYGANAEQMAANGLTNTGFSESSQVSMFNAYQNRVATARESFNQIVTNFNNSITEARLQNNSILAEIAYEAQKQQLELNLQGFQYKNQLLLEKADKKTQIDQDYYTRWQDVLEQINTENALAEQIRQFNASLAEERRQFNLTFNSRSRGGGGSSGSGSGSGTISKNNSPTTNITKDDGSKMVVDTKSVLAAGLGPASGQTIANAINTGKVTATSNGKTVTVSKKTPTVREQLLNLPYSQYKF